MAPPAPATPAAPTAATLPTYRWQAVIARLGVPLIPARRILSLTHRWRLDPTGADLLLPAPGGKVCSHVGVVDRLWQTGQQLWAAGVVYGTPLAARMRRRELLPEQVMLTRPRQEATVIGGTPLDEISGDVNAIRLGTVPLWPGLWFDVERKAHG